MNYPQALEYIKSAARFGIKPGLERIKELCRRLGNPQSGLKVFHIAGTNGKGSVSSYLTHILATAGYKTGWFTSPYLEHFSERIRVFSGPKDLSAYDDANRAGEIGEEDFARIMTGIEIEVSRMLADGFDNPTEFELITAAAFLWFYEQNCDFVVLETGLGGRLDSTNIVEHPEAVIICSLSYEHVELLGPTIARIAAEKAGIMKTQVPVYAYDPAASYLSAGDLQTVRQVLEERAAELSCPLTWVGHDSVTILEQSHSGQDFLWQNRRFHTRLLGSYQPLHAILAAKATTPYVSIEQIKEGINIAFWPGRLEICSEEPFILLDGAHNVQGCTSLAETLEQILPGQRLILLTGMLADKNTSEMLRKILLGRNYSIDTIFATEPDNPRKLAASSLADQIEKINSERMESLSKDSYNIRIVALAEAGDAARQAMQYARERDLALIAFGSLYLIGNIRHILRGSN
ncbi:MAG TPA: folylpolyglutamate synthase/dihydrofolate synthase family protein [Bacillota bacterium]|nr:folylpolyglutamate synthase/dihydrofolate synthase family protein [Bacillota bacterium]